MPKLIGKFWVALGTAAIILLAGAGSAQADKAFPYLYAANGYGPGTINVLDTGTNSVVAKIATSSSLYAATITPDARTIYATDGNNLLVIDAARNIVTSTISVGPVGAPGSLGMVITPDGANLYFTTSSGTIVHFAVTTNVIVKSIVIPSSPPPGAGMAVSPDGAKIFVAIPSQNAVIVIDTATDQISATIPVGTSPNLLAITPDGAKLYVLNQTTISVVGTATGSVVKTVPVSALGYLGLSYGIAITPDGSRVYVDEAPNSANGGNAIVDVIATSTDSVIDKIYVDVGNNVQSVLSSIVASPDGAHIYVTDGDRLVVIDSTTNRPTMAIPGLGAAAFSGPFRSQSTLQASVTGNGVITSEPSGLACGANCSFSAGTGSVVKLTATASGGSVFAGWNGACTGTSDCTVVLSDDTAVSAMFNPAQSATNLLSVSTGGVGKGTVTTMPSGIRCGTTCTASYSSGSTIMLIASPEPGSVFTGWSGGTCSGTGNCSVALDADTTLTANFAQASIPDTLSVVVKGVGDVISNIGDISCLNTFDQTQICAAPFQTGTPVILTPISNGGSVFTGWSGGGCSGTTICTVELAGDVVVTANFSTSPSIGAVYLNALGNGSGTISSNPAGYYCGSALCGTGDFPSGTTVTLTATPDPGSTFAGWSAGACTGTGPCTLTLTGLTQFAATFNSNAQNATLSLSTSGTGAGSITSSEGGLTCGTACSGSFPFSTYLTLTATPNSGSVFVGWTGDCSGFRTAACILGLNRDTTVSAIFVPASFNDVLAVSLSGTGSGGVSSSGGSPSVISCGAICSASLADNTPIALTAVAATGSIFTGWSNPQCGSSTSCSFTLRADTSTTATFQPASALTVVQGGTAQGMVTSTSAGISCPLRARRSSRPALRSR